MPRKPSKAPSKAIALPKSRPTISGNAPSAQRDARGRYLKGSAAAMPAGDPAYARRRLNLLTLDTMREAFEQGGRRAVQLVMKSQPAQFLKLCVMTLPREMQIEQRQGPKAMSDDAIAQAIETIERMLASRPRAGDDAKLIEGEARAPSVADDPSAPST